MDAKQLKEKLTDEDIIKVMESLGADYIISSNENEIHFRTICHCGDSHKLYYYRDTKSFHCYTSCGAIDIINITQNVKGCSVPKAIKYICNVLGISNSFELSYGFEDNGKELDWEILNMFNDEPNNEIKREFDILDKSLLNRFYKFYHPAFYEDGISFETMERYNILYDILKRRIIIPHFDENENLIAIRCRNLDEDLIEQNKKYMPIIINNKLLSAKQSLYLYGLNFNKENIKRCKKVIIFEAEKSVMQLETMLGRENNIGVALCSSNLTMVQIKLLKELGVNEVIIAVDKEYEEFDTLEEKLYAKKVRESKINKLLLYFNVSVIWDKENLIGYKDSPTDRGKNIFLKLYSERIKIRS